MKKLLFASIISLASTLVNAGVVAVSKPDQRGSVIILSDEAGPCIGSAHLALWIPDVLNVKINVPACWIFQETMIILNFLDGDRAELPISLFEKPSAEKNKSSQISM